MIRIGFSKDIHRLIENRKLILGGVIIPSNIGLLGHSDADVVLHAVSESILGALGLKDLGTYFPDTDPKYEDYDSKLILKEVISKMKSLNYHVNNVDILIELEAIKLKDYIDDIKISVADLLEVEINQVSIKAATNEGLDAVGRKEACTAYCSVLIESNE